MVFTRLHQERTGFLPPSAAQKYRAYGYNIHCRHRRGSNVTPFLFLPIEWWHCLKANIPDILRLSPRSSLVGEKSNRRTSPPHGHERGNAFFCGLARPCKIHKVVDCILQVSGKVLLVRGKITRRSVFDSGKRTTEARQMLRKKILPSFRVHNGLSHRLQARGGTAIPTTIEHVLWHASRNHA